MKTKPEFRPKAQLVKEFKETWRVIEIAMQEHMKTFYLMEYRRYQTVTECINPS